MSAFLTSASAKPQALMISGHDTTVASLGGLLDAHWQAPGAAADDPVPGGGIVIERLRDAHGQQFFRFSYRSQSLLQIRNLTALTPRTVYMKRIRLPECGGAELCTRAQFDRIMRPEEA